MSCNSSLMLVESQVSVPQMFEKAGSGSASALKSRRCFRIGHVLQVQLMSMHQRLVIAGRGNANTRIFKTSLRLALVLQVNLPSSNSSRRLIAVLEVQVAFCSSY